MSDRPCSHAGTLLFNGSLTGLSDSDDVWNLEREQRLVSSAITVKGGSLRPRGLSGRASGRLRSSTPASTQGVTIHSSGDTADRGVAAPPATAEGRLATEAPIPRSGLQAERPLGDARSGVALVCRSRPRRND